MNWSLVFSSLKLGLAKKKKRNPFLDLIKNKSRRLGMTRAIQNTGFSCMKCGKEILPLTNGSYRNHCPHCLSSRHVDNKPGDRSSQCKGLMKPIGLRFNSKRLSSSSPMHSLRRNQGKQSSRLYCSTR